MGYYQSLETDVKPTSTVQGTLCFQSHGEHLQTPPTIYTILLNIIPSFLYGTA